MRESDNKYIHDNLTLDELRLYRDSINKESETELEKRLSKAWEEGGFDSDVVPENQLQYIKKNLDSKLFRETKVISFRSWWKYAAAVLLILLGYNNYRLSNDNKQLTNNEIAVITHQGEKVKITLPDGTVVNLNEKSKLIYKAGDFNRTSRQLLFEGEGYFAVTHNAKCPFKIRTTNLDVSVLGTKFYLIDRVPLEQTELILDEGRVSIMERKGKKSVILEPGQQAKWDFASNQFILKKAEVIGSQLLRASRLSFVQSDFTNVVKTIEEHYQIKIAVDSNYFQKYAFTGTLPSNNLLEALRILEKTYYLSAKITNGNVYLFPNTEGTH